MSELPAEIKLTPILGGYRVKTTEYGVIEVYKMLVNWRITRTPLNDPTTYDRGWCYAGTGQATMVAAVLAAWAWDGADNTEPEGWVKRVFPVPGCGPAGPAKPWWAEDPDVMKMREDRIIEGRCPLCEVRVEGPDGEPIDHKCENASPRSS